MKIRKDITINFKFAELIKVSNLNLSKFVNDCLEAHFSSDILLTTSKKDLLHEMDKLTKAKVESSAKFDVVKKKLEDIELYEEEAKVKRLEEEKKMAEDLLKCSICGGVHSKDYKWGASSEEHRVCTRCLLDRENSKKIKDLGFL